MENTFEKFTEYLSMRFNIPADKIKKDTVFTEDLGIDSLALYSLIEDVEKEFKIKLDIDDIISISTAGNIYEYVSTKINE